MKSHYKLVKGLKLRNGDIIYVKGWGNVIIECIMELPIEKGYPQFAGAYRDLFVNTNKNQRPSFLYGVLTTKRYPKLVSVKLNNKVYKHVRSNSSVY